MLEALLRFEHHLPAGAAGRDGRLQELVVLVACGNGEGDYRLVGMLGVGIE